MVPKTIAKSDCDRDANLMWNTFVDLLASGEYDDLSAEQCPAHLVFWYEGEVQNGGHDQYFENRGTEHLQETIVALGSLGANCERSVLQAAAKRFLKASDDADLSDFDSKFEDCSHSLTEHLENHLAKYQKNFVEVV